MARWSFIVVVVIFVVAEAVVVVVPVVVVVVVVVVTVVVVAAVVVAVVVRYVQLVDGRGHQVVVEGLNFDLRHFEPHRLNNQKSRLSKVISGGRFKPRQEQGAPGRQQRQVQE